jgi:hypothetical protein
MNVLAQENFTANVTATSPDAFDSVTSTFFSEVGGPTTSTGGSNIGVSGDPRQLGTVQANPPATGDWNLTSGAKANAAQNSGFMGGWFYFNFTDSDTYPGHDTQLMMIQDAATQQAGIFVGDNNEIQSGANHPNIAAIPINQWVFLGLAWSYNASTQTLQYQYYTETPGQALTMFYSGQWGFSSAPTLAQLSDTGGTGYSYWGGRVGTFFIASINSFGDVAMPSTVIAPVMQKLYFGVDPVNGNDNNSGIIIPIFAADGTTVIGFASGSQPWKTLDRVNTALEYANMFAQNVAWINASDGSPVNESQSAVSLQAQIASGAIIRNPLIDDLVIDTASGPFNISTEGGLQLNTNVNLSGFGSNIGSVTNGGNLQDFITIAKSSWTLAPGATLTYESSDTAINSVLWQDQLWMNHITGTSFSQVESQLESTPGSFWTDGTTMYVHPFNNTDPATDSSVYQRSPGGTESYSIGVVINVNDAYVYNLAIGGTAGADESDNDPIGLYCFGPEGSVGGLDYFDNLYLYYASKHAFGWTSGASDERIIVQSVDAEQGSPYVGPGGQDLFVSYNGTTNATDDQMLYLDCTANHSSGLIDSTAGQTLYNQGTFYAHNNGGEYQFSDIWITDCHFDCYIGTTNVIQNLIVTGTTAANIGTAAATLIADRDTTTYSLIYGQQKATITNCIMQIQLIYGANTGGNNFEGDSVYLNCVFDSRNQQYIQEEASYFYRVGPSNLTIRNSIFLSSSRVAPVLDSFQSSDTIVMDHNIYDTNAAQLVAINTDGEADSSLAQWQALGYDADSIAVADSAMNINLTTYVPFAQTPITNDIGMLDDMTGTVYTDRRTIGVYQYVAPSRQYAPPPGTGLS